ncbi:DUF5677 domain-containing protein [Aestuariibacter sp. A3R04]|uniref:DUF5677 domain-containing protein n=1 Tax=Aestuariibacter sp. A3R04 TaxID=2841571 RepID=UPI00211369FC|nr:DUF5677 domain-containing protein [Aestuariibacter sp. A3R04]
MDSYHNLVVKVLDNFRHLKFDKKHAWHLTLVTLYCSIVEYSDTILKLNKEDKSIGLPLIARGLLEAYVDLKNLSEDKAYGYNLEVNYLAEWLKVAKEAGTLKNPFLKDIGEAKEFGEQVEEWESELVKMKENGANKLNQFQKFDLAGMTDEYRSIYNFLCAHSHNNKRSLFERFFVLNEDKTDFKLEMFRESETGENQEYLDIGEEYLMLSSQIIHRVLETGLESEFKNT